MALTLRTTEVEDAMLTEMAEREHRSRNEIALLAIRERAERLSKSARTRAALDRIEKRDAEALDLLSQ